MKVEKLITANENERYVLVDNNGEIVDIVLRYLKFKDNSGSARNTLRTYAYQLKLFFEFLEMEHLALQDIEIDDMAAFMRWLQNPYKNTNIYPLTEIESPRAAKTINLAITTVMNFFDYLERNERYSNNLSNSLRKNMVGSKRGFKDFLYHINRNRTYTAKYLKLKEPKQQVKTIPKESINKLLEACNNIRDKFLLQLLWESSIRIGEALSLWLEDFEIDADKIHIRDRGELENFAEIKTVSSIRSIDVSRELTNDYLEYISEVHTEEVDTNYVFIKLCGRNKYKPMQYIDVVSLFKRLQQKTGIYVMPHILRHTSLTALKRAGWENIHLMKRAGHAHVQTTIQMYVHPSDEDIYSDWVKARHNIKIKTDTEAKNV